MKLKCPLCKSEEINYYMGAQFGKYQCKNCGYVGVLVIEEYEEDTKRKRNKSISKK